MKTILFKVSALLAIVGQFVVNGLSIPDSEDGHRAAIIQAKSTLIQNVNRTYSVGNQTFVLNPGPEVSPSSMLYFEHLVKQATELTATTNYNASKIRTILEERLPLSTEVDFRHVYEDLAVAGMMPVPSVFDSSDENFGAMRLGLLGYNLKLVSSADFSEYGQLSDEAARDVKYIPSVLGFFCHNVEKGLLLPLAITLVDTGLTYTKADSPGEWQLAKMAFHATEVNFQQMRHFVETHLVSVPVQVEMIRSLATEHPVYALLDYHFFANFGMEYFARKELLSPGTPYDQVTGYGATGSLRAVMQEFETVSVELDLHADLTARGMTFLPDYRLNLYGTKYYEIIKTFVIKYVHAYYPNEKAIEDDAELQTWAGRSSRLEHIHGFPPAFTGFDDLVQVLAHYIFQNAIKHHFMNGQASWHSTAAPFNAPALYNQPLPTEKGVHVNPFHYVMPNETVPNMVYLYTWFTRQVAVNVSALNFYQVEPFTSEEVLVGPIQEFRERMEDMEHFVTFAEQQQQFSSDIFKPSALPFYSFI
ncbi:hypothetical protein BBJ29_007635 [Phytophthora kernoviae]|uniref:Lipoxygenase domain-containing protein n=1 Tax=Phytophthora kernoviae TaxID=325452 RepID=A0A3F2RHH8_9STRA|nr:hypothetical protein BBP00_00007694 [Phytophthora kernoviae]RLN62308.1 hypothetical protein BBJ29_007635 [Phytophthora kernoviae]